MSEVVTFASRDDIGRIVLNRPERGNAVSPGFIEGLAVALDAIEADPDLRVVIMSGEGKHFCAGADLGHLLSASSSLDAEIAEMARGFHQTLLRLYELDLPVIAAVQGGAVGAGLGLALAADFVICADDARLATGYARLGLCPDAGVSFFLTRALGARRANRLLMSGAALDAEEALSIGLIDAVCARERLSETAEAAARDYLGFAPRDALAAMKRLTRRAAASTLAEQLDQERAEIVVLARGQAVQAALASFSKP